jgi:hypothetical protein
MDDTSVARKRDKGTKPDVSRRKFITKAMAGAGATAVVAFKGNEGIASENADARQIKVPDEFAQAAQSQPAKASFPMTGAQVFARVC